MSLAAGVSTTICKSFHCTEFDDGTEKARRYLTADMSVDCDSAVYTSITIYAGATFALLPFGVPLAMHLVLWTNKRAIEERVKRTGDEELEHLAVWFAPYKRDKWWYVWTIC